VDIPCVTLFQRLLDVFLTRGYASDSGLVPQKFSESVDEQVLVADTPLQITGRDEDKTEPQISVIGAVVYALKSAVADVQDYAMLCGRTFVSLVTPPYYLQDILQQMDSIGAGSLPIILLSGFFIGAVMVLQTGAQFTRFGQTSLTGDVVAIALVRELGPSLTGLLVTGRCATGIASELGSMLVTEQVDAMRAMGTNPIRKLVAPRVIATLLTLPLLTAMTDFMGLLGGCVASVFSLRLTAVEFWRRAIDALDFADLMQGFTKPFFFAFILATIGCYKGLTVRGGTQGVGRATTQAAVLSSVMIIVADAFLTKVALYFADKLF
jgi:phospholipid/cholesterol/gamma-HCH transport system permease protein